MSFLQGLKVVSSKRPVRLSPIQYRRNKLIDKLQEQLECARAKAEGRDLVLKRQRIVKNIDTGQRCQIEQEYRIKPWWYTAESGNVVLEVKYGSRAVELVKGKNGIELATVEDLPAAIELIKKAVESGELDGPIANSMPAFGRKIKK